MSRPRATFAALAATAIAALTVASSALAVPLTGSAYDTGDGDQANGVGLDWQGANATGNVKESPDANDDCFVGGVKELTPNQWAFNRSAGGCTPGKSNLRVAFVNPESAATTTFGHFAFFRNDTTGNSFLTFELNQTASTWTNATGTAIPCRSNGDLLLSYEVGGSTLTTSVYRWTGDGSGPPACPNGANGTFTGSGALPPSRFQGTMNSAAAITNFVNPGAYGVSFPGNSFGEGAIDLPAVLQGMGQSPCFGFLQMQVHSRSSSSISSAMIDYTNPVPVNLQSCAATGTVYQDTDGDGARDGGEPGLNGFDVYADLDDDGTRDAGEPTGSSDATGFYRILNVPAGSWKIRQVPRSGWNCTQPAPCSYSRSFVAGGNSTGNDFGNTGPSTASGAMFDDLDADGVRDGGEPGLSGWTMYADLDGDGTKDADEPSGVSGSTGAWSIAGIPSGTYTIREVAQGGWTCSAPTPCTYSRTFTSNSAAPDLDFGAWTTATVAGNVWEDVDGDGAAKESGDADLSGWQVFDDSNGNDAWDLGEPQTTTGANGGWSLGGLAPGAHTIRTTLASTGWYCTWPALGASACEHALTLTSGQLSGGHDFGSSRYATASGTKFDDANSSGVRDSGEGALAGFTFYVDYDSDNALDAGEPTGTSDGSGNWSIGSVRAGSWTLREQPNGAYACTRPSPCTYALTLASGGSATGREFGNFVSRSVSGTVFGDADADGLDREAGESGQVGWTVYSDANNNSAKDAGEPSSVSNSLGQYTLTGLANGSYRIRVVAQAGWTCSFPASCVNTGSIGSGQSDTGKNFGVWGPSKVTGTVFEDANADGAAQQSGEAGLSGRTVYVDSNSNSARDAGEPFATSDATGAYSITGVNPGTYTVRQVVPAGWTCSRPSLCSYSVTITAGDATGRDFGSYTTGSVAGNVYEDADADGAAKESAESNLSGRTIYLDANGNGAKDAGEISTTTDASGDYSFAALAPGSYSVRQLLPSGWTPSSPSSAHAVTVSSRAAVTGRDFASYTTGSISGTAFEDADFDGSAFEAGDTLLPGRTVYLDANDNGAKDSGEVETATGGAGAYSFSGLAPGSYVVRPVLPADWACSNPADCAYTVTVTSQSTSSARDFGSYLGASVTGSVFEDADADGAARETGEQGLAGKRVYLDADFDATRDASEPTTLTDSAGDYAFTGITARSWQVRVEPGGGWSCDSPSPCSHDVALTSGSSHGGRAFGLHTSGSIAGHLFTDRDKDGDPQEFGENDQPERTVYLDADDDGQLDAGETEATTDDSGNYSFSGLTPGSYTVRQVLPGGWSCSTPSPCSWTVALASRDVVTARDFSSWTTASFTGTYFEDEDADGDFPEPGEPGIAGRTLYVDSDDDAVKDASEPAATTAGDGSYSIAGLAPGTYVVRPTSPPSGWTCSYPSPCATILTVEAGEHAQDVNVGAWTAGTVSGTVYEDADASGGMNGSETGLAGWTVYADEDGDGNRDAGEPSDVTGSGGGYQLDLTPGAHTLRELRPSGWSCSAPSPCSHAPTVVSSGAVSGLDFGNVASAAEVSGVVFDDGDADGAAREAGEAGRAGRTVYVDGNDNEQPDAGEPQTTTAADGSYTLAGLTTGVAQTLRVEEAAGRTCSVPDPCAHTISPANGDSLTGRDFGSWAAASIAGRWWEDADGDGQTGESGEGGHSGLTVYLDLDGDGTLDPGETTATTQPDGSFQFTGLEPGDYTVRAVWPNGHVCSTACVRTVSVVSGEDETGVDIASYVSPTISGRVSEDADADGTLGESGELPRAGVVVYLDANGNGQRDSGETQTTTDGNGDYAFTVAPGAHEVRVEPDSGWACSAPSPCVGSVAARSGDTLTGRDFGIQTSGSITGAVLEDLDADGTGEGALAGREVYVDSDGDGSKDAGEPASTTGTGGGYSFDDLPPGPHVVKLALPSGWTCSAPAPCSHDVTLASGESATGRDFAAWRETSIGGHVTSDSAAAPALSGETVYLDSDGDGSLGSGEPTRTTGADGAYEFTGLRPGSHTVRYSEAAGRTCTVPSPCRRQLTLVSGQAETDQDFILHLASPPPPPPPLPPEPAQPAAVSGVLFEDRDSDGREREAGEPALAGWMVYEDANRNGAHDGGEPSATSNGAGAYHLGGLDSGKHILATAPPSDKWVCSLPERCSRLVDLSAGYELRGQNFGAWRKARITGYKFEDADEDGSSRELGDLPLAGWTIYADLNGNGRLDDGEPSAVTDADGRYGLTNLPLGSLLLRELPPTGSDYRCTFPDDGCAARASLASGDEDATADFGSVRGIPAARNHASVVSPAGCRSGRFRLRVRARLAREVTLRVDRRHTIRRAGAASSGGSYSFKLNARRFRRGVHKVRAHVTFLDGTERTLRATFYRCRAAKPRYTG